MQVHFGLGLMRAEWEESVVCIGTFDGVHVGHQAVIGRAVDEARRTEMPCVLATFDRHPAAVLAPERCPKALSSLYQNLAAFEELGVAAAVIVEFDRALSQTSAETFFEDVVRAKLRAAGMVIGHDFAFGRGREGTPEWLQRRILTHIVPPFEIEGRRVSSSAIREAVTQGRMEDAARWLGRPFEVTGVVVAGKKLGRELGFPTINVARSFDQATPADGVYSAICHTPFGAYKAAINIGLRPAVGGTTRTIEAFLIGYPGDSLYGLAVSLSIYSRMRDEQKFETLDRLREQMARDIEGVSRSIGDELTNENRSRLGGLAHRVGGGPSRALL